MVDADVLQKRLTVLLDALADLRRYRDTVDRDALRTDRDTQHMVLHALYVAVQASIDVALHALADAEQGGGTTYREAFQGLAAAGLIDPALSRRLEGWAGLRNILAHHYGTVDHDLIYDALANDLGDLESFASRAAGWLPEED